MPGPVWRTLTRSGARDGASCSRGAGRAPRHRFRHLSLCHLLEHRRAAAAGTVVGPRAVDFVLGIVKAYTTRVGEGPVPSRLLTTRRRPAGQAGRMSSAPSPGASGAAAGSTRCWCARPAPRAGSGGIALTKLDVLDGFRPTLKICVAYELDGTRIDHLPMAAAAGPGGAGQAGPWRAGPGPPQAPARRPTCRPSAIKHVRRRSRADRLPHGFASTGRSATTPSPVTDPFPADGAQLHARRRWSLVILLVGLPLYIVAAVSLVALIDRPGFWVEFAIYLGLGPLWALPFRMVFAGIACPDPEAGAAGDGWAPPCLDRSSRRPRRGPLPKPAANPPAAALGRTTIRRSSRGHLGVLSIAGAGGLPATTDVKPCGAVAR